MDIPQDKQAITVFQFQSQDSTTFYYYLFSATKGVTSQSLFRSLWINLVKEENIIAKHLHKNK